MAIQAAEREPRVSEGISSAVLLVLMLLCVTASIQAAHWADGLEILSWSALAGFAFGLLIARLPVPGWAAHPLMLALGAPVIATLAGTLLPRVLTFEERYVVLFERFLAWISKATLGGVSTDNLMFVVQVAYLTWLMAHVACWYVYRRHQAWGAILPTGAAILFNLYYALPQNGLFFTVYVLSALVLLVRLNLHGMEQWWRRTSVGYSGEIGFDFLTYGVGFSIAMMVFAWLLPAATPGPAWLGILEPLQSPWQQAEDQFNRVFSSLNSVGPPVPASFFGSTLTMGGPVNLSTRPVMDVQSGRGSYWRAALYDKYTGIGWINTHAASLNLASSDPRLEDAFRDTSRIAITQTYKIYTLDQNILYAQSEPLMFSLPTEVRYGQPPSSDLSWPMLDVTMARARRPMRPGDTYGVVSAVSVADEESLRAAPTNYSPWVKETYLQLPDNMPARVGELAREITQKYDNAYDQAAAIERYLRKNIQYNDFVSAPPQGRDGVDYTLFDRPEGYCNYYASAMAVLARSVGIPARIASGYAMGDLDDGTFHVVEANAHSWVEVYFPRYGWLEFEPTSSKPEIARPKKPQTNTRDQPDEDMQANQRRFEKDLEHAEEFGTGGNFSSATFSWINQRTLIMAAAGVLLLGLMAGTGLALRRRSIRMASLAPAARMYETIFERAGWLGLPEHKSSTPYERAAALGEALPKVSPEVEQTALFYVRETFANRPLDEAEQAQLTSNWANVRAEWWRGVARRTMGRVVTPARRFATGIVKVIDRWGKG